jgi:hypothetical protein
MLLLAGVIAGALYNPWTGAQTRDKLLEMIAGNDDLSPLEGFGETTNGGEASPVTDEEPAAGAKPEKQKASSS